MSTGEANIICITQITRIVINNVLLIHNWRFRFLSFGLICDLAVCKNRMNIGTYLSAKITKLAAQRVQRSLVFEKQRDSNGNFGRWLLGKCVLCYFRFDKRRDGGFYERFWVMQVSNASE